MDMGRVVARDRNGGKGEAEQRRAGLAKLVERDLRAGKFGEDGKKPGAGGRLEDEIGRASARPHARRRRRAGRALRVAAAPGLPPNASYASAADARPSPAWRAALLDPPRASAWRRRICAGTAPARSRRLRRRPSSARSLARRCRRRPRTWPRAARPHRRACRIRARAGSAPLRGRSPRRVRGRERPQGCRKPGRWKGGRRRKTNGRRRGRAWNSIGHDESPQGRAGEREEPAIGRSPLAPAGSTLPGLALPLSALSPGGAAGLARTLSRSAGRFR